MSSGESASRSAEGVDGTLPVAGPAAGAEERGVETRAGLRLGTNVGSICERTESSPMRRVASSTMATGTISEKGAGRAGSENLPGALCTGRVCESVSQSVKPRDQMSEAGNGTDSGRPKGEASGQAEEDSPAARIRSEESLTLSPTA